MQIQSHIRAQEDRPARSIFQKITEREVHALNINGKNYIFDNMDNILGLGDFIVIIIIFDMVGNSCLVWLLVIFPFILNKFHLRWFPS